MHGFESVLQGEQPAGITESTQRKVEDLLDEIDVRKTSIDWLSLKSHLREIEGDESDAALVMRLCPCRAALAMLSRRSRVARLAVCASSAIEIGGAQWFGAIHYVELVDSTEGCIKNSMQHFPHVSRVLERP